MADFFQNGVITTLQKLGSRSLGGSLSMNLSFLPREEIWSFSYLPFIQNLKDLQCHELLKSLKKSRYLYKIVLSLDRATEEQFRKVKKK
ncbi:MAG: hypothetical protein Q9M89_01270 [Persephonella sp.]|nr:hypothetical protein [Persephonella sp.]